MRGGRVLIILGIIVVLGAVAVGAFLWFQAQRAASEVTEALVEGVEEGMEYVPPENLQDVVVAAQNIPRGTRITSDTVQVVTWPSDSVPSGALTSVDGAFGRIARVDIVLNMPIMEGMLTDDPSDLGAEGSDAALRVPPGQVAYSLVVGGNSSVAWAIQPGDYVDVIVSLLLVDLDEEFQTILPNSATCVQPPEGEGCQSGVLGRMEVLPNGWVMNLTPSEGQRARMVTQLTIQNAMVLHVGEWPVEGEEPAQEPPVGEAPPEGQAEEVEPAPSARAAREPVTLVVTTQDAMVLKYLEELGASVDLVLRSAGDREAVTTDSVTLQYIFERFNVELPPKLPYGFTPPVNMLRPGAAGVEEGAAEGEEF